MSQCLPVLLAQIFVRTVVSSRVMGDKDSVMSFIYGLLIVLYRRVFVLQVVTHNTIQVKLVHISVAIK
jgi:hypothetical protein